MTTIVGKLSYHPNKANTLGRGGFSTVFKGIYSSTTSRPVAIKRVDRAYEKNQQQEVDLMKKAGHHPNIVECIHTEMRADFLYIAMELCSGTLKDYVEGKYSGPKFKSEREILFQVTQGLAHLHGLDIVHLDIKPTNILIYVPPSSQQRTEAEIYPQVKLADFGRSKIIDEDFTNTSVTNPTGTKGWMAPELYQEQRAGPKVDIFALGLIFGYTLSGGQHPFGDDKDQWAFLIKNGKPMKMTRNYLKEPYSSEDDEAFDLIEFMLAMNPDERPTVEDIVKIIFFVVVMNLDERPTLEVNRRKIFESIRNPIKDKFFADSIVHFKKLLIGEDPIDVNVNLMEYGFTLLHILCCGRYDDENLIYLVQLLLKKGADVNAKNRDGLTQLQMLCWKSTNDKLTDIVQLLIKNGADVNTKDKYGCTPLHYLCLNYKNENLIDIVHFFIKNGAEVNAKETDGWTPLHVLCRYYQNDNLIGIVRLLIENGAEVNTKQTDGSTPLHRLCWNYANDNLIDIVQLLIENGVEVNAKDKDGDTPLHYLCYYNEYAIKGGDNWKSLVSLFEKNGASMDARNDNGRTPNDFLIDRKNRATSESLNALKL